VESSFLIVITGPILINLYWYVVRLRMLVQQSELYRKSSDISW